MIGWYCSSVKAEPLKHVVAALTGGFVGVLLLGLYLMPPSDSGQLAAWVQAFGSIGAIAGAIFVMRVQQKHRLAEKTAESERLRSESKEILKRKVIFLLVAVNTLLLLMEEFNPKGASRSALDECKLQKKLRENRYKVWQDALQDIDITRLGVVDVASKIVNLRLQVKVLIKLAEDRQAGNEVDDDSFYVVQAFLRDVVDSLRSFSDRNYLGITDKETLPEAKTIDVIIPS